MPLGVFTQHLLGLGAVEERLGDRLEDPTQVHHDRVIEGMALERLCDDVPKAVSDDEERNEFVVGDRHDKTDNVQQDRVEDTVVIVEEHQVKAGREQVAGREDLVALFEVADESSLDQFDDADPQEAQRRKRSVVEGLLVDELLSDGFVVHVLVKLLALFDVHSFIHLEEGHPQVIHKRLLTGVETLEHHRHGFCVRIQW